MWRSVFGLALLTVATAVAAAHPMIGGTFAVVATGEGGDPVPGVEVRARGPAVRFEDTTDDLGRVSTLGLAAGRYLVIVIAPDHPPAELEDVRVAPGHRVLLRVDVPARPGAPLGVRVETIAGGSAAGVSFPIDEVVPYVPIGRNLSSVVNLGPTTYGANPDPERFDPSISGGTISENVTFIEGVNVTEAGLGALGTYSSIDGAFGIGLPPEVFDEIRVGSGGFEPSVGATGGGASSATLRSGTNRFAVDAARYLSPSGLEGDHAVRINDPNIANLVESRRSDAFVAVSGPAIRDRLFFFAAYNRATVKEEFSLISGNAGVDYYLVDTNGDSLIDTNDTPLNFEEGETIQGGRVPDVVTREREINGYAVKLTGYAGGKHRLELSAFGDPSDGDPGPQQPTSYLRGTAALRDTDDPDPLQTGLSWGGDQVVLRHQAAWTPRFTTETSYARRENSFRQVPHPPSNRSIFSGTTPLLAPDEFQELEERQDQYSLAATNVLGPVELTYGVQHSSIEWGERQHLTAGSPYTAMLPRLIAGVEIDTNGDGTPNATGTGLLGDGSAADSYAAVPSATNARVGTTFRDLDGDGTPEPYYEVISSRFSPYDDLTQLDERAAYAQVTWSAHPRATVRAGLRWVEQELRGSGGWIGPLTTLADGRLSGVGETAFEAGRYAFDGELAPRIGATWDILGDGRQRLYATAGRYHQRMPADLSQRAFSIRTEITGELFDDPSLLVPAMNDTCWTDTDGDGLYETTVACHTVAGLGRITASTVLDGTADPASDPDPGPNSATRLPYVDEIVVGYARPVFDLGEVEVRYIGRRLGRVVEDVQFTSNEQTWNLFWGSATFAGTVFAGHGTSPFGDYVIANPGDNVSSALFPKPTRDHDALELIVRLTPQRGWHVYLDYRLSRTEGNYIGSCRDACAITDRYDFPAVSAVDVDGDGTVDDLVPSATMAGAFHEGPLGHDRRHVVNAFVSKRFDSGLNLGGRLAVQSGRPVAPLLAHPAYRFNGVIPGVEPLYWWLVDADVDGDGLSDGLGVFVDGDGTRTDFPDVDYDGDGLADAALGARGGPRLWSYTTVDRDHLGRTDTMVSLDLHASFDMPIGSGRSTLTLLLDVFNALDSTDTLAVEDFAEVRTGVANPDQGRTSAFAPPRSVRIGVRYHW